MSEDTNQGIKSKTYSKWQTKLKLKKLNDFKLSKEDKFLIKATDNEIREIVINNLKTQIEKIQEKKSKTVKATIGKPTEEKAKLQKRKKHLHMKLSKLKKCLNDEGGIKARMRLIKKRQHRLRSTKTKIDKSLGQLKNTLKRCFKCKKRGHVAEECTYGNENENNDDNNDKDKHTQPSRICYNCGSLEHNLYSCGKPVDYSNLPFAECFKCKAKGHITANCPENENGIFIRGGSCFICKGKDHLAKNCPQKQIREEAFHNKRNRK